MDKAADLLYIPAMQRLISTHIPKVHLLVAGRRSRFRVDSQRPNGFAEWLLAFTLEGRARFNQGNDHFDVMPGDLTLIQPNVPLFYGDAPPERRWSWMYAIFRPYPHWEKLLHWPEELPGMMCLRRPGGATTQQRIHDAFSELLRHAGTTGERAELLAMNALERLLLTVDAVNPARMFTSGDPRLDLVSKHIHDHLNEPLSVEALAAVAHLSASRLAHLFHSAQGTTPMEFVNRLRMDRARHLLDNTDLPVKAIGASVGYPAPDHFSKRFRQINGLSPIEYRNRPGAQIL